MEQSKGLDTLKEMSTLMSNIGLDPNEYVEAIKVLLLNKTILKRMSENAYEKSGEFSVSKARVLLNQYVAKNKS